jgi:PA domain
VRKFILSIILVLACATPSFAGATIEIINFDGPGEGFNDPTPVLPVGGNTGTTLGAQRLIAFRHAADIWAATLDSNQTIIVQAAFNPLAPNVLGSAGATFVFSDFVGEGLYPGPEYPATWYGSALADKRAGAELNPGFPDINAQFSSNFNFYLGLDNNHGPLNDLVAVLLHEFAHGLNFQNFVDEASGRNLGASSADPDGGQTDIYARHTFDTTTGLFWDQMTAAQRAASAVRFGRVVWEGTNVFAGVPLVLSFGSPEVRVVSPASIAGTYQFGTAAFGTAITALPSPVSRPVVLVVDAANTAGPSVNDGCTALTNGAAVAGNIALVERGTCGFVVKARVAQDAGAAGVIIMNNAANAAAAPPGMAGVDPLVVIPSVSITWVDGNAIRAALPAVSASIGKDITIRAGADNLGRARLYMPNPVQAGSSGSHFDSIASRNLLMEPAINPDLTHSVKAPEDLTLELLRDVGWFADTDLDGKANELDCDPTSNTSPFVIIHGRTTRVKNIMSSNGCTITDLIEKTRAFAKNRGHFVFGVAHLTNSLRHQGFISNNDHGALQSAAAKANVP